MRHKYIFDIGLVLMIILAFFLFNQRYELLYQSQQQHNGLSANTFVIKSKSNKTVQTTINDLDRAGLGSYQVQFATSKTVSYVYESKQNLTLPLSSGRQFTSGDFKSQIPVVIAGSKVKLYKPTSQAYWHYKGRYLSVIGMLNDNRAVVSANDVLISASKNFVFNNPHLKSTTIYIDGNNVNRHLNKVKKITHAKSLKRMNATNTPVKTNFKWLASPYNFALTIVCLILISFLWCELLFQVIKPLLFERFKPLLKKRLWLGLWRHGFLNIFGSFIVASLIGFWIFNPLSVNQMLITLLIWFIMDSCYLAVRLLMDMKRIKE